MTIKETLVLMLIIVMIISRTIIMIYNDNGNRYTMRTVIILIYSNNDKHG